MSANSFGAADQAPLIDIDVISAPHTFRGLLRPGGRISALGYEVSAIMGVSSHGLVLQEQSVIGSRFAWRSDMEHVIRMVADGLVTPVIGEVLPLERVNEAVERLEAGTVGGRLVMSMA